MLLFRTQTSPVIRLGDDCLALPDEDWQSLVNRDDLHAYLLQRFNAAEGYSDAQALDELLPPLGDGQELWAAGVTYFRSRTARMEESEAAGGGSFYDRVYHADRPELFLKATPHRVVGHGQPMRLRRDSKWLVPEPELTLVITRNAKIIGYTIGNDLSCRDIEGENPLYLPQAKTWDGSAAVGPAILVSSDPLGDDTSISIDIRRDNACVFADSTQVGQMKKKPATLVEYLYRECSFPQGCLLMTGTGVVPPNDFSLKGGDEVRIAIDGIGTLVNRME